MIWKSGFTFVLEFSQILKPRHSSIFHYCYSSSSKKPPPITLTIKKDIGKSPKFSKHDLNKTNKMLFGPLLKKSSASKKKEKELIEETPVTTKKSYSSLSSINDIVTEGQVGNNNNNNENIVETIPSGKLFNNINISTLYQDKSSFKICPLINPIKGKKILSHKDDTVYNISIFEGGYRELPSVSKILEATMPPERKLILERWKQNMILALGEEGFKVHKQALFDRGHIFHKCIEMKLKKEDVTEEQLVGIDRFWNSIKDILDKIINVKALESRVIHSPLEYQGCVDCVGFYKDIPVVIEFKTSSKPKVNLASTYDNPLQLAAYLGALNYDPTYNSLPNGCEGLFYNILGILQEKNKQKLSYIIYQNSKH